MTAGVAQDRSATLMEARLYVNDARDLDRLGSLAGDLYVCSRGADENGAYLVLVTDDEQLAGIRHCGLKTAVTWANLDDKFRLLTGEDPHDAPRLQTFGYYFTYGEMRDSVYALAAAHPEICSLFTIGVTSQGRDILCLKVSDNAAAEEDEPACYFSGACHGDEPMGTSIVMEFLDEILAGYGTDSVCTWLVDNREIYVVPILNPDCSVFCSDSGGAGVYWRKNRRVVVPPNIGVDPSRNHGFRWGCDDIGSSPNPAAHAYRGPNPWSDAEATAARDLEVGHRFRTKQDFHCYGGYNTYPWCYTYDSPPEQDLLQEVLDTFQTYNDYHDTLTGQASHVLYLANGTQPDWGFSDTADKFLTYSFVIEADTWFYACWNDSALMRKEVEANVPTLFYLARIAGVYFGPVSAAVSDSILGNATGMLDPGETANLWFTIRNQAIHPLDSACAVSARLVSLDTLVTVLDSVKSFPDVQRHSDVDNNSDQFRVCASGGGQPGDTIRLRLEVTFTDAGNTTMMPVPFEIVLGEDVIGIGETGAGEGGPAVPSATLTGQVLFLSGREAAAGERPALLNALGRRKMVLRSGANDVSHLSTGVYFVACSGVRGATALRRVLVVR
ncbi:zinc carboxypeptidase [candidate division WOR-3 bacterium]|nr:zinc carboxypeptidase [candidate division WOR-3 bacterium]